MLDILSQNKGIGYVIGKLWFKKSLPIWACQFIEMSIIISADHGPAVSGAHNTIVTTRAGKDLISSLVSGLLTIGPRFGGALNEAGKYFFDARKNNISPDTFVRNMKESGLSIPGIGHKIYHQYNPDKRSQAIQQYAIENFNSTATLNFALEVEAITLQKRNNLILNVDGAMAACFIDMIENLSEFSSEEKLDIINNDQLNGLFTLARTIGLIGHIFDQQRLQQPLYRHPWDDIFYQVS